MLKDFAKRIVRRCRRTFRKDIDIFLKDSAGIIHIGANEGQERDLYASLGLPVIWIEPLPDVFKALRTNISCYPNQRAFRYLITDENGKIYDFHVASNRGASSSIFDLARHVEIWPEVSYTQTLKLDSVTLPTFLKRENIEIDSYNALVLDTQGSELLILRSASSALRNFRYVKLEVPDFEAYKGCCTIHEVTQFMLNYGFLEKHRNRFAESPSGGHYYDIVYRNKRLTTPGWRNWQTRQT